VLQRAHLERKCAAASNEIAVTRPVDLFVRWKFRRRYDFFGPDAFERFHSGLPLVLRTSYIKYRLTKVPAARKIMIPNSQPASAVISHISL